jgi:hypothetical protein
MKEIRFVEVNDLVVHRSDKLSGGKEAGKFGLGRDGAPLVTPTGSVLCWIQESAVSLG